MSSNQSKGYGFGVATQTQSGQILECSFYSLGLGDAPTNKSDNQFDALLGEDSIRKVKKVAVEVVINLDEKPKDATDVYLRLHLLSHRFVAPHSINLDGIFGLLANVVWTSAGACEVEGFEKFIVGVTGILFLLFRKALLNILDCVCSAERPCVSTNKSCHVMGRNHQGGS